MPVCDTLLEHCKQFDKCNIFYLILRNKKKKNQDMILEVWHFEAYFFTCRKSKIKKETHLFLLKVKCVLNLLGNLITITQRWFSRDFIHTAWKVRRGKQLIRVFWVPFRELRMPLIINHWCLQRLHGHINVDSWIVTAEWNTNTKIAFVLFCNITH